MVKRYYFYSAECNHEKGVDHYSFICTVEGATSDPIPVFEYCRKKAIKRFEDNGLPTGNVKQIAFNRV